MGGEQQRGAKEGSLKALTESFLKEGKKLFEGGGEKGKARQKRLGRMTARERVNALLDAPSCFFELGLFAAFGMYEEYGGVPCAGIISGIGKVSGRWCMMVANDATVKAGAFFPQSVKKVLRAQRIAYECRLPVLYLVDSSGVFLPLQDEIFPDEDDFGRIFRNNAVLSAQGIPQIAAIMGSCIAGGGYLPVLCDTVLMTEGSGLYIAGPALVKAAIGQETDAESLGGAKMHAEISGTVDFYEKDDASCLKRLKSLVSMLKEDVPLHVQNTLPEKEAKDVYGIVSGDGKQAYDIRDVLKTIFDKGSFNEYKEGYGKALVTGYAKVFGMSFGIVASQRAHTMTASGHREVGGVIYDDSADKAARFVMSCNVERVPLVFFQDVMGFMVGKEAEEAGIIKSGAKLINAISNSIVPKITVIIGNSFGAGNYALCGKAYDPNFIVAWPSAKIAVMGSSQAASTLASVKTGDAKEIEALKQAMKEAYERQTNIYYAAARGWVDAIIEPDQTRNALKLFLELSARGDQKKTFHTGVLQV